MKQIGSGQTMTVKEVVKLFNCDERTIQRAVKELFPEIVKNGIETRLNELQVTAIKLKLDSHHNLVSTDELPKTKLEKNLLIQQAMILQQELIDELQAEKQQLENRVNLLIHDAKTFTSSELAKELNLRSARELNQVLKDKGIQYKVNSTWVLTAMYSNEGFESIKQEELENGKIIYNRHWTGKGRDFILNFLQD